MPNTFIFSPFHLGTQGVAVTDDADRHLRDKIEAVLFTAPGERVNNPEFGVGLSRSVFDGLDELLITALEFRISDGLRRDIGDELIVDEVRITAAPEDGELTLFLAFRRRTDRQPRNLEIRL
jgi:phage baseplate assembly protein W